MLVGIAPARADVARARELLLRSLEPADTTYAGVQVTETRASAPRPRSARPQQVKRNGNRLRIDMGGGQVVYDDGARSLLYLPGQKLVEESPSRFNARRLQNQKRLLQGKRVTLELLPEESVAGRPCHVIAVRDSRGKQPVRKVWVDKENYLQLRQDVSTANGRTVSTYFKSIQFDAAPAAASLVFTPPADVRRVAAGQGRPVPQARAAALANRWGGLLRPGYVPAGYRFRNYFLHEFKGETVLVGVYARPGTGTLSVFQGPSMGMSGMAATPRQRLRMLTGKRGNADVAILAPLPEEELQKVMGSLAVSAP